MTPTGSVNDGNGGANYTVTIAASANGVINARPITVTAAANSKTYDGTNSASATPTITSGALQGSDGNGFTEAYASANPGSGLTLTPSGAVNDGAGGANYAVTFASSTNGAIAQKALTVSGVSASGKIYDATTAATIDASGATLSGVVAGDIGQVTISTGGATGAFVDANAGVNKTVNISGLSLGGAQAGNYTLTGTGATATATISPRAITVTAVANTKVYDAGTTASATPIVTSGALQGSDALNFTEAYSTKNVGTGLTLTPSGSVNDGNGGANYTVTIAASANGVINARPITVTAAANSKTYDGTNSASATPTITSGALQGSDSNGFTEAYASTNAGSGLTLTPSGAVNDGNGGANYAVTFASSTNGAIAQKALTVSGVSASGKIYDATTAATIDASGATLSGVVAGDMGNVAIDRRGDRGVCRRECWGW